METVSGIRTEPVSVAATDGKMREKPLATRIWNTMISVKLAIRIIILWAYNLMDRINLFDMYHSWWFLALLVLFTVNLTCCTIDRFPKVLKTVRNPRTKLDDGLEKTLSLSERWKNKGAVSHWTNMYKAALARAFATPKVTETDGVMHLYAEKGAYSRFGAYATHAGIVIVFIGAIAGNVLGYKSYVNIPDGQEVSHLDAREGKEHINLPFAVRNNKFRVETYPSGQPKKYASDLSVMERGMAPPSRWS